MSMDLIMKYCRLRNLTVDWQRQILSCLLKKYFEEDKNRAAKYNELYKKYNELQKVWKSRNIIDFDDKYSMEEIVSKIYEIFLDKHEFVKYLEDVREYYTNKLNK